MRAHCLLRAPGRTTVRRAQPPQATPSMRGGQGRIRHRLRLLGSSWHTIQLRSEQHWVDHPACRHTCTRVTSLNKPSRSAHRAALGCTHAPARTAAGNLLGRSLQPRAHRLLSSCVRTPAAGTPGVPTVQLHASLQGLAACRTSIDRRSCPPRAEGGERPTHCRMMKSPMRPTRSSPAHCSCRPSCPPCWNSGKKRRLRLLPNGDVC